MTDMTTQNPQGSGQRRARDKIRPIHELGRIADDARRRGQSVVLAHGVFDLIHMGHVRHLEHARTHGDVLFVTVTSDRFVNKGPGRPVFAAGMRAEMLAALEYVDWVGINDAPSAELVLHAIKPTAYVKGSDYADAKDDVTGKIVDEQHAVEAYGGRIVFTDDIVFSSSALINRHLNVFDPEVKRYLDHLRETAGLEGVLDLFEQVKDKRVLLVGDAIVDEYNYVFPMGRPSKENIIATRFQGREQFAGGAIAAANHVAGICREVELVTVLGRDDPHEGLIRAALKPNVVLTCLWRDKAPTTCKSRFVDSGYVRKLFEVQHLEDTPLPLDLQGELNRVIAARAGDYDVVIVTDFGHGMIYGSTIDVLIKHARFLAINAQTNSANLGFNLITKYPHADYLCIDAPEAQLAVHDKFADLTVVASELLPRYVDCRKIILTHGKYGCVTFEAGGQPRRIPAITDQVVDTMGAGDAFFVITAPLVALGAPLYHVGFIGNVAGAIKVGIVGHRASVDRVGMIKAITTLLK
jgi:rfaE bifunctional protein nucleotidyltransferase chain/domain